MGGLVGGWIKMPSKVPGVLVSPTQTKMREIPEPVASSLCALLECAVMRKDHCTPRAHVDVGMHPEAVAAILSHTLSHPIT